MAEVPASLSQCRLQGHHLDSRNTAKLQDVCWKPIHALVADCSRDNTLRAVICLGVWLSFLLGFAFVREQCSHAEIRIIVNPGRWAHCRPGNDLPVLGSETRGKHLSVWLSICLTVCLCFSLSLPLLLFLNSYPFASGHRCVPQHVHGGQIPSFCHVGPGD